MNVFSIKNILLSLIFISFIVLSYGQGNITSGDSLAAAVTKARSDTALITALVNLGQFYKQLIPKNIIYKDKALAAANKALQLGTHLKNATKKGDAFDLLSRIAEKSGDQVKAKALEQNAVSFYLREHQPDKLGMAYKQLGGYFSADNDKEINIRLKYDSLALQAYRNSSNKIKQGETCQDMSDLHSQLGDWMGSIQSAKAGLAAFQTARYPKVQGLYNILNAVYDELGDYKQAISYGLQAVSAAEAVKDTSSQTCAIYNHLAKTYFDMKEMDKAYAYFKLSLKYAVLNHDNGSYVTVALNLANAEMILNRYQEAFKTLRSIKISDDKDLQAILYAHLLNTSEKIGYKKLTTFYCLQAMHSLKEMEAMDYTRQVVYSALLRHFLNVKQYAEVPELLKGFSAIARFRKSYRNIARVEEYHFMLDSAQGNYISAIRHIELARSLRDTLLNEEKNKSVSQLEIEYETEKKVRELKLQSEHIQLLNKEGQLQQASLQKAAIVRNVTIFGIVMMASLLFLSNSRYRIKKRNNLQLEAQQTIINNKNKVLNKLVDDKDGLLKEKEWLLKEIHHRVKNNLQIVISLLNSQSAYLNDAEALEALRGSQHRMQSISLIHQKLYQSENLAFIDMKEYICDLIEFLKQSFDIRKNIEIDTEVDLIELDVSQAVPLGLILNEAITNAIKYAFTGLDYGQIIISFFENETGLLTLTIQDNGKGLPQDFDIMNCGSLGMNLIRGLSKQLNGKLLIDSSNGLKLQVTIVKRLLFEQKSE